MKHVLILTALSLSVPALAADATTPTAPAAATSNELQVGVKGMVCAFCAQGIEKKLKAHSEIEKVKVSLEKKFVHITFKDGQRLPNEKIAEILKDAGYEAVFDGGK